LSIVRRGHTWLPMGKRSGFATSLVALPASDPATPQPIAVLARNSRLDITFTSVSFLHFPAQAIFPPEAPVRLWDIHNSNAAESQSSLRPPSLSKIESKFSASPVGPASRKLHSRWNCRSSLWRDPLNRSRLISRNDYDSEQDSNQSSAGVDSLGFGGGAAVGIQAPMRRYRSERPWQG